MLFKELWSWLSFSAQHNLQATLITSAPFHMNLHYTFIQQLEDKVLFGWERHRPLVPQMKQLIMANTELGAKQ